MKIQGAGFGQDKLYVYLPKEAKDKMNLTIGDELIFELRQENDINILVIARADEATIE